MILNTVSRCTLPTFLDAYSTRAVDRPGRRAPDWRVKASRSPLSSSMPALTTGSTAAGGPPPPQTCLTSKGRAGMGGSAPAYAEGDDGLKPPSLGKMRCAHEHKSAGAGVVSHCFAYRLCALMSTTNTMREMTAHLPVSMVRGPLDGDRPGVLSSTPIAPAAGARRGGRVEYQWLAAARGFAQIKALFAAT